MLPLRFLSVFWLKSHVIPDFSGCFLGLTGDLVSLGQSLLAKISGSENVL